MYLPYIYLHVCVFQLYMCATANCRLLTVDCHSSPLSSLQNKIRSIALWTTANVSALIRVSTVHTRPGCHSFLPLFDSVIPVLFQYVSGAQLSYEYDRAMYGIDYRHVRVHVLYSHVWYRHVWYRHAHVMV